MSALSMQADELREMAKAYENCGDCGQTSALLREAADTIISLRDRLQEAEKAKALLSKSEAQKIARIDELERLVRDMVVLEKARNSDDFMTSFGLYGEIKERLEALGIEGE